MASVTVKDQNGVDIPVDLTFATGANGETVALLAPVNGWGSETVVNVTVTTACKDLDGVAMPSERTTHFTSARIVVPDVASFDPGFDAHYVANNQVVAVTFTKAMDVTTITV